MGKVALGCLAGLVVLGLQGDKNAPLHHDARKLSAVVGLFKVSGGTGRWTLNLSTERGRGVLTPTSNSFGSVPGFREKPKTYQLTEEFANLSGRLETNQPFEVKLERVGTSTESLDSSGEGSSVRVQKQYRDRLTMVLPSGVVAKGDVASIFGPMSGATFGLSSGRLVVKVESGDAHYDPKAFICVDDDAALFNSEKSGDIFAWFVEGALRVTDPVTVTEVEPRCVG